MDNMKDYIENYLEYCQQQKRLDKSITRRSTDWLSSEMIPRSLLRYWIFVIEIFTVQMNRTFKPRTSNFAPESALSLRFSTTIL